MNMLLEKHLPGQHDQSTHGSGGGGESDSGDGINKEEMDKLKPDLRDDSPKDRKKITEAVSLYTGGGYLEMNEALRSGDRMDWAYGKEQTDIRNVKKAIDRSSSLKRDVTIYRGIETTPDELGLSVGSTFEDRGFISATVDGKIAQDFAKGDGSGGKGTVVEINVRAGKRMMAPDGSASAEGEVILSPGSKFKVVSIDDGLVKVELQ